ncbi:hypothetical protein, partial [Labilibaculum sp.]|uniref:hypothetical protein n=1 Tax=Labilibaculum sp. TaxID=2060723 RepID=UPI003567DD4C
FSNGIGILLFFQMIIACAGNQEITINVDQARYFDSVNGCDENNGVSVETAWKSLGRLNEITWQAGASINLKAGSEWPTAIALKGSGSENKPILITSYGEGKAPLISGNNREYTLKFENQQYWEINNLEICNYHESEEQISLVEWEAKNNNYWAEGKELPQDTASRSNKSAILILAEDAGELKHFHFSKLEIHGVNGDISDKDNGGMFFEITGNKVPTWFSGILVEDCFIHDVDRSGISNRSSWNKRTLNSNTNWTPSQNILIRNNVFERTGANALIIIVAESPRVEYNLFDHCAIKQSGNASFPFNCDNALWQYNEARYTKYNVGDVDAGGFDSDYRCKNTVIQYNFSHDNEYGGVLVCCQGGSESRFNVGTQICYNIFANNQHHVFRISGKPDNTHIYNNVVYYAVDANSAEIIWHKNWGAYPFNTYYSNNIFYSAKQKLSIDLASSQGNSFSDNLFWGEFKGDVPRDKMEEDPLFEITNFRGTPPVEAFKIKWNSPAKNTGTHINTCPELDFFGNKIQDKTHPCIGVHNL